MGGVESKSSDNDLTLKITHIDEKMESLRSYNKTLSPG
jgi:hypothetical protein